MPEPLIRRIDLRGAAAPADYRAVVPRAAFDVDAALEVVRPISEAVRTRGVEAIAERLVIDVKTVETHIARILTKLDLHQTPDEHRRVLAVLAWLRG